MLRGVALLPWKYNLLLLRKGLDDDATFFYATEDIAKGWEIFENVKNSKLES